MQMDAVLSFSTHHLEVIRESMQRPSDEPERRRLPAMPLLLQTSGATPRCSGARSQGRRGAHP